VRKNAFLGKQSGAPFEDDAPREGSGKGCDKPALAPSLSRERERGVDYWIGPRMIDGLLTCTTVPLLASKVPVCAPTCVAPDELAVVFS